MHGWHAPFSPYPVPAQYGTSSACHWRKINHCQTCSMHQSSQHLPILKETGKKGVKEGGVSYRADPAVLLDPLVGLVRPSAKRAAVVRVALDNVLDRNLACAG
jgi:hypothetical protein